MYCNGDRTMKLPRAVAIQSLCPTVQFTTEDNKITYWSDDSVTKPTDSEIATELARLQAIEDFAEKRRTSYPTFAEQLDLMYHSGFDAWKAKIKETKDKYPKP